MKKLLYLLSICISGGIIYFLACGPDPVSNDDKDITGTISGIVTDTSGKVLSGVSITTDTGGYTSVTDTVGHYTIPYVKAGTYSLTFTKEDYADTTVGGVTIAKTEDVVNINMQMRYIPPFGTISGNVTDTSGVPLSGVSATTDSGGFTSVTDTLGNYTIPNVTPGTYSLTFTNVTYADTTADSVAVTAGQNTIGINARMRHLPQVGTISGNVTDTSGIALSGVSVTTDSGGFTSVTDTLGNYTIPSVDPGTYLLTFSKTDYADTTKDSVTVTKGVDVIGISVKMRYTPAFGSVFGIVCDSATGVLWPNVPILISPVGQTGNSDANGEYLITQIPVDTYSVAAYSTYHSNTISNVIVIENDTTYITDTIWSVPNNLEEHDIYGNLTGNLSDIAKITATVTGDSIPEDNPIITSLSWLPVSKQYTGFVYVPQEGLLWDVEVKVFDSNDRVTGYQKMAFDAGVGDIAMPAFDAWNAKPIPIAFSLQDTVSINDTINLKGSATDTIYGNGIVKWEWKTGSNDFIETTPDSNYMITAPSTAQNIYTCILRVTDDEGNDACDTTIIEVAQDPPSAVAGDDTIVSSGETLPLIGSNSFDLYGNISKYEWDIGANGLFIESSTGDTNLIVHDSITACVLRVTDDDGNTDLDTVIIFSVIFREVTSSDTFPRRRLHTSLVFNDKMWVIGGENSSGQWLNDIWYSTDGAIWILATDSAQFPKRSTHSSVVFDNKMWVIGGYTGSQNFNDVWYSSDGTVWTEATPSAEFTPRTGHTSVVFDNKMWVIGGVDGAYKNDVWYSSNGEQWSIATASADFPPRNNHASTVFQGKMWVVAGSGSPRHKDVWYSTDGINWAKAYDFLGFDDKYSHCMGVFYGKLWLIAGMTNNNYSNDVWISEDGVKWSLVTLEAEFPTRSSFSCIAYANRLWVIGGHEMNGSYYLNDIWYCK